MGLYRVLRKLSKGRQEYQPGDLVVLNWLDETGIGRLVGVGAVARIAAPPLRELPGWTLRAEKLAAIGIEDAEQMIEADAAMVAAACEAQEKTVRWWQEELRGWLTVPKAEGH